MKIIDRWGNEHYIHEVDIRGGTVAVLLIRIDEKWKSWVFTPI
jgi:hypothetical protein